MKIVRVLVLLIAAFLLFVNSRPATFHIERSAVVAASPEAISSRISDFHEWAAWSPWEHLDPAMKKSYTGTPSQPGSTYQWVGNDKVGEGKMTLTDVKPGQSVTIQLDFIKPFASTNITTFVLAPEGSGTKVTWNMDGKNNFMAKAMGLFMNMDKMVGPDFERGLGSLQKVAAAAPATMPDSSATMAPAKPAAK